MSSLSKKNKNKRSVYAFPRHYGIKHVWVCIGSVVQNQLGGKETVRTFELLARLRSSMATTLQKNKDGTDEITFKKDFL